MSESIHTDDVVQNRSEIVVLMDAKDANPNGNPLSGSNRPRIDPQTGQCVITDVCFKRYLRDQLDEDGHGVYVRNTGADEEVEVGAMTRAELIEDVVEGVEDADDVDDTFLDTVLESAVDVRMFGAAFTFNTDDTELADAISEHMPGSLRGPIQFTPGRTLHEVEVNEEYNSLTSVVATKGGKEQGGYDLDDHRIKYGLFAFEGRVNENGAEDTKLQESDVKRLDTLVTRALKNQTNSRAKTGQEPRVYLRVEYSEDSYHLGDLRDSISLDDEHGETGTALRSIQDATLDINLLVDRLSNVSDRVETVHVNANDLVEFNYEGETGGPDVLYDALRNAVGDDGVHVVDVYDEYEATLAGN